MAEAQCRDRSSGDTRRANPLLEIEYILNYILQFVGSRDSSSSSDGKNHDLLNCRLVNKFWNNTILRILNSRPNVRVCLDTSNIDEYVMTLQKSDIERTAESTTNLLVSPNIAIDFTININSDDIEDFNEMKKSTWGLLSTISVAIPGQDEEYQKSTIVRITNIRCYIKSLEDLDFWKLLNFIQRLDCIDFFGPNCVSSSSSELVVSAYDSFPNLTTINYHLEESDTHQDSPDALVQLIKCAPHLQRLSIAEHQQHDGRGLRYTSYEEFNHNPTLRAATFSMKGPFVAQLLAEFKFCTNLRLSWELPITTLQLPIYDDAMLNAFLGLILPNLVELSLQQHLVVMVSAGFVNFLTSSRSSKLLCLNLYFMLPDSELVWPEDELQDEPRSVNTSIKQLGYFSLAHTLSKQLDYIQALTTSLVVVSRLFPTLTSIHTNMAAASALGIYTVALKHSLVNIPTHAPDYTRRNYKQLIFPNVTTMCLVNYTREETNDGQDEGAGACAGEDAEDAYIHCSRVIPRLLGPMYPVLYPKMVKIIVEFVGEDSRRIWFTPNWTCVYLD